MKGTLVISAEQSGTRLDQVLPAALGVSRSFAQKHVKEGHVTVNGKNVAPHYFVKAGDAVAWDIAEEKIEVVPNAALTIPILFEDDDLLVVDKPSGLVVHQGDGHRQSDTLVNWLLAARPSIAKMPFVATKGIFAETRGILAEKHLRPGIVHRLDREVSGIMVIAKTQKMYDHLRALFDRGDIVKEYEAIVYGIVAKPEDVITFPLARSKTKGWKIAARPTRTSEAGLLAPAAAARSPASSHSDEREAITRILRLATLLHYTHLRILPATGRMHQIRAHLAAYGHPIVGDTLYAGKALHPDRAPRLFLHATQLRFRDTTGKERVFTSPLPGTFAQFLKKP